MHFTDFCFSLFAWISIFILNFEGRSLFKFSNMERVGFIADLGHSKLSNSSYIKLKRLNFLRRKPMNYFSIWISSFFSFFFRLFSIFRFRNRRHTPFSVQALDLFMFFQRSNNVLLPFWFGIILFTHFFLYSIAHFVFTHFSLNNPWNLFFSFLVNFLTIKFKKTFLFLVNNIGIG